MILQYLVYASFVKYCHLSIAMEEKANILFPSINIHQKPNMLEKEFHDKVRVLQEFDKFSKFLVKFCNQGSSQIHSIWLKGLLQYILKMSPYNFGRYFD